MVCYSKDYYFDSYAHFGIHEEMLKDEVKNNILCFDLCKCTFEGENAHLPQFNVAQQASLQGQGLCPNKLII